MVSFISLEKAEAFQTKFSLLDTMPMILSSGFTSISLHKNILRSGIVFDDNHYVSLCTTLPDCVQRTRVIEVIKQAGSFFAFREAPEYPALIFLQRKEM